MFNCCERTPGQEQDNERPLEIPPEDNVEQLQISNKNTKQKEFFKAIEDLDCERIQCFVDEGYEMKAAKEFKSKKEAFHFLAEVGDDIITQEDDLKRIFNILLEAGCQVNSIDMFGNTPLMLAVAKGSTRVLKFLLDTDVDIEKPNNEQNSPLHWASKNGKTDAVNLLLCKKANINAQNKVFQTPLHLAVIEKKEKVVELLISWDADQNLEDFKNQWTPLQYARFAGSESIENLFQKSRQAKDKNWLSGLTGRHVQDEEPDGFDQEFITLFKDNDVSTVETLTVVNIFLDTLPQIKKRSLEDPPEHIKKKCRYFCNRFKCEERKDVIKELRKNILAGMTGPLADDNEFIVNMDHSVREELTRSLCGPDKWKSLANGFGISGKEFDYYDRYPNPAEAIIEQLCKNRGLTFGQLYNVLADKCDAAGLADQYL